MRAKKNTLHFNIDEIERADTINYVDDTDIADVRQNKNALIRAKKITDKYKRLSCKIKKEANLQNLLKDQ